MNKVHIGIDPGKNGHICVMFIKDDLSIEDVVFFNIPKISNLVDIHSLNSLFRSSFSEKFYYNNSKAHCVIEKVHSIYGASASSTFEFGRINGILETFLVCYNIPYTLVQPKEWQREMFKGVDLIQKASSSGKTMKTDTKAMALIAAKRLFPNLDFRISSRSKKEDDGKIDSLLLCEYSRRNF